ncbi:MAG TPA: amidohydrolase family protein [Candidatus Limnocylindrales bacterium]|nr:amidohydrolase family protein [Candidatus Limnocylindrales bacterium]
MTEVLWDVRVFDPEAGTAAERQAITFEGDTVVAIADAVGEPPEGAHDLRGATVLPGLIDAHVHVASDTSRSPGFGPPPAQHGEPPRPAGVAQYILAATADRFLRSGFTTVRDVGAYDDEVLALRVAIDNQLVSGPRVYTCGRIISATAPGGEIFQSMYREADGPWEMRKAVREQLKRGAEFIKFMATGARSVVLEDPEPPQMTLEEMRAIVDEAHRMGKRVAAHAEGLEGTRWALEAGADTIEHGLALHREPMLLDDMAERGTVLVPTISTFHDLAERFANIFPAVLVEQAKRQLEEAMRTVDTARRAGVTIALGYDSGPPGSSAQELMRLLEAGLSVSEGLRAATSGGAAALGRGDLGRLAVGSRADAVAVDGRPDEDPTVLTRPEAIRLVVGRGRVFVN